MMEQIRNAKVKEIVDVSESSVYKTVEFTLDKELGYSWVARVGYKNVFPMASVWNVRFFKTLDGAKQNFIKRIAEMKS